MLIQNVSSIVQPTRLTSDTPVSTSNGAHIVGINTSVTPDKVVEKQPASAKPAQSQPTDLQLQKSLDHINTVLLQSNINIQFNVDASSKRPVVKLIDTQTGEVLRQFPTDAALSISRSIDRLQQGMLLSQKA